MNPAAPPVLRRTRIAPVVRSSAVAICLPVLVCLAALACGAVGASLGCVFDSLFFFIWPCLALYFAGRLVVALVRRLWRAAGVLLLGACLSAAGCLWGYSTRPFLEAFEWSVQRVYNLREIQAWALEEVKRGQQDDPHILRRSEYPKWAKRFRLFTRPHTIAVFRGTDDGSPPYVRLAWGSGPLGLWGLDLGPTNLPTRGRLLAPGVWFIVSPEPFGWRE